jgi:hypothetical protein
VHATPIGSVYDWQHYVPLVQRKPGALRNGAPFADLPAPLQQLRRALLREARAASASWRRCWRLVPTHGLDAVLVAVDLVLETGRPSAEHVLNVLTRLREGPPPQAIATVLQRWRSAPLAAIRRSLRRACATRR